MNARLRTTLGALTIVFGIAAVGMPQGAWAQGAANPFAPAQASDTLNAGSPSGGLNSATYINRANSVASQAAKGNPFGAPVGGPAYQPPANPYFQPNYPGYPGTPGTLQPTPTQGPPPVTVVTGERVYSHLQFGAYPPELLQDAEKIQVPKVLKELQKQYYDNGTHGDAKANDNVWSYVTQRNNVMSPEEFRILNRIISALSTGEDTSPREFFRLPVATTDPLSDLPKMTDLEQRRDEKISEWDKRVMAEFRVNREDVSSAFWPVFVPPPPSAPRIEIPPGFDPAAKPTPTPHAGGTGYPGGAGGPMLGGPMMGGPGGMPPGASSSYGMK